MKDAREVAKEFFNHYPLYSNVLCKDLTILLEQRDRDHREEWVRQAREAITNADTRLFFPDSPNSAIPAETKLAILKLPIFALPKAPLHPLAVRLANEWAEFRGIGLLDNIDALTELAQLADRICFPQEEKVCGHNRGLMGVYGYCTLEKDHVDRRHSWERP